jgi:hypothetical protein
VDTAQMANRRAVMRLDHQNPLVIPIARPIRGVALSAYSEIAPKYCIHFRGREGCCWLRRRSGWRSFVAAARCETHGPLPAWRAHPTRPSILRPGR